MANIRKQLSSSAPSPIELPQSVESEIAVIGGVLIDSNADLVQMAYERLTPEHFYQRSHQIIWSAILDLRKRGEPVDTITLTTRLQFLGKLEEVGGAFYLSKLGSSISTGAHTSFYIEILCNKKRLRMVMEFGAWMAQEAPKRDDVDYFLSELEEKLLRMDDVYSEENLLHRACDDGEALLLRKQDGKNDEKLLTGVEWIDREFGGFEMGRMDTIGARPGKGKSALIEQVMDRFSRTDCPSLLFEKDMTIRKLVLRMACRSVGISLRDVLRGIPDPEQCSRLIDELRRLRKRPLYVESPGRLTGFDANQIIRRYKSRYGIKAFFLDHFQILDVPDAKDFRLGLTRNSMELKRSIQENDVAGIILAQLNREIDKRGSHARPQPSDVKECDQLYADSDMFTLLWHKKVDQLPAGASMMICASVFKDREQCERDIDCPFYGPLMKFIPMDPDYII